MQIQLIETGTLQYNEMAVLRMKVLLEPIGIPSSYINPEKEKDDFLIGAFKKGKLIGCCILSKLTPATLQLRQMAVDALFQKKGIGAAIIAFAEDFARNNGFCILMMHARDTVIPFYEKCGYKISGDAFFEVGISHHKMGKALS